MGAMSETMIICCPACAGRNRVPTTKLGGGTCGKCGAALFMGRPLVLNAANFDVHAARSDIPLVVDFWAAWCGPCRQMAPAFEAAAAQLEPRVRLGKLDTEAEQAIATRYAIRSIPSLVVIHRGQEIARQAGAMPTSAIVQWVRGAI